MRIAFVDFVCDPSRPGKTGLSDLVWDMARELARAGDEVHIVAPYPEEQSPSPEITVHQFRMPLIGYRNVLGHALIVRKAWQELRRLGGIDVVHCPEYFSPAVLRLLGTSAPIVFTEPGNIYERIKNGNPYDWWTTQAYKWAARRSARSAARIVATSDEMRAWWEWTGAAARRIVRVPLGIDPLLFQPRPDARPRLGMAPDERVLLYAARLSRENGADLALRAFQQAQEAMPGLRLHMLGDGPERPALERLAADWGIGHLVTWHGWVDFRDLPLYYSAADAYIFSGTSGGTPRTLIQAMGCGAACVASSIGGIVDHVEHNSSGLLVPPRDVAGFADAVRRVMGDHALRRALGDAARAYVHQHLTWAHLARRLRHEVYAPLSGKHPIRAETARVA
jgi:glycosyltransferase involved in cell wall biosynthesis